MFPSCASRQPVSDIQLGTTSIAIGMINDFCTFNFAPEAASYCAKHFLRAENAGYDAGMKTPTLYAKIM
jgi:hypothetical protein